MGTVQRDVKARKRRAHIFDREKRGHYVEPAWVSYRLFEAEKFPVNIYDPACGWGTTLKSAEIFSHCVSGSDIIDRRRHKLGKYFRKLNFLIWSGSLRDVGVVCNPPFDHVQEFCEHALKLGAAKVAMICLVRRLNAAHWLQQLPLRRIWLLTPRPSMPPGSWIAAGNKPGGGTQDFAWLIFERGYAGRPEISWLHRDEEKASGGAIRGIVRR
jgi:hypothetical protein